MPPTSTQERPCEVHRDRLFGVYIAPMALMMVTPWLVTIALRRVASHFGVLRYVWHPALFVFAVYMIVLSSITLIVAH
jgi:protein AaeX